MSQNNAKISTSKLHLKAKNIYNILLVKPRIPCFETAYFGKNVKKVFFSKKVAQIIGILGGYFKFSKYHNLLSIVGPWNSTFFE